MTARRWPILVVLVALVVAAILIGNADASPSPSGDEPSDASALAPADAVSTAWFCPGPPPGLPYEQETVSVSNPTDVDHDVVVTVFPDDASVPVSTPLTVPAASVVSRPRAEFGPPGPVTVEAFTSQLLVESGLTNFERFAVGPCATTAADEWHVAAGTTVRGVEEYLVIFNPLGTDAKVDIVLYTGEGMQELESLTQVDIPRRSRVVLPVHDPYAVRQERVAVTLTSTIGQVVVEQFMVFGPDSGFGGVTRSLGVLAPAPQWTFADGTALEGASTVVALSNPGSVDAEVDVFATPGPDVIVNPVTVLVPRGGVVWVPIGGCGDPPAEGCVPVPPASSFAIEVDTDPTTPVVAEVLARLTDADVGDGVAAVTGAAQGYDRWIVPRTVFTDTDTILAVANPDIRPVTVDIAVVHDGTTERPDDLQGVEIAAGQRAGFDVSAVADADAILVVTAAGPIVVERTVYSVGDFSRAPAVPAPQP